MLIRSLFVLSLSLSFAACSGGGTNASATGGSGAGTGGAGGSVGATFKTLSLTWSIQKADGTPDVCPAAYSSLKVHVNAATAEGNRNGDPQEKVFECGANAGSIQLQTSGDEPEKRNPDGSRNRTPPVNITGKYTVTMLITEPSGELNYASTLTQMVDLSGGDKTVAFVVTPNASPRLTFWRLYSRMLGGGTSTTDYKLTCASAGVDHLRVKSKRVKLPDYSDDPSPKETEETYPCSNLLEKVSCPSCVGGGQSAALEYGYYDTSIDALANGTVVGSLPYGNEPAKVDRETVKLLMPGTVADHADVWTDTDFTVFIENR
jgi:hypothetical protein